jgi:hippurate hydrolase
MGTARTQVVLKSRAAGVPLMHFSFGGYDAALLADLRAAGEPVPANHFPSFAPVPEPTLKTGVRAMSLAVLNALQ